MKRTNAVSSWWAKLSGAVDRADGWKLAAGPAGISAALFILLFDTAFTPDSERFVRQADSLIAGGGYGTGPALETFLPPGYAIFLAAVRLFSTSPQVVVTIQGGFVVLAGLLVFRALWPYGRWRAIAGASFVAGNPWIVRQATYVLSETLGLLLCAVVVYLTLGVGVGRAGLWRTLSLGVVLVVLPLTNPATLVFCGLLGLAVLVGFRRKQQYLPLVLGALIPWGLWQAHCLSAGAGIQWTLTKASDLGSRSGHFRWVNTWLIRQRELHSRHHPKDLTQAPRRAFSSDAERTALMQMAANSRGLEWSPEEDAVFARLASRNRSEQRVLTDWGFPLLRAAVIWVDMPQLVHFQMEYVGRLSGRHVGADWKEGGPRRAALRLGKALGSTVAWLGWCGFAVLFVVLGTRAVIRRDLVGISVGIGLLAYSVVSGVYGLHESRRNFVFFPAMALLLRNLGSRDDAASRARQGRERLDRTGIAPLEGQVPARPLKVRDEALAVESRRKALQSVERDGTGRKWSRICSMQDEGRGTSRNAWAETLRSGGKAAASPCRGLWRPVAC